MGTNFYIKDKEYDDVCELTHIGKMSAGWRFNFAYDNFKSIEEVREDLKNKMIVDEYGEEYTYEQFMQDVEDIQHQKTHADGIYDCFINIDGYDFAIGEFS